jgi:ribosomal protein L19
MRARAALITRGTVHRNFYYYLRERSLKNEQKGGVIMGL